MHASVRHERRQRFGQLGEQPAQLARAQTEVIVAKERLVGALGPLGQALPVGACELDVALKRGGERREVVVLARHQPALLALGMGVGHLRRELGGHPARPVPVAAGEAHDVEVERLQLLGFQLQQPAIDLIRCRAFVCEPRERAELVRPRLRALAGHHHPLVPGGEHGQRIEVGQLGHATAQLYKGVHALERTAIGGPCRAIRHRSQPGAHANGASRRGLESGTRRKAVTPPGGYAPKDGPSPKETPAGALPSRTPGAHESAGRTREKCSRRAIRRKDAPRALAGPHLALLSALYLERLPRTGPIPLGLVWGDDEDRSPL